MIWTVMLASLVLPGFLVGMGWLLLAHPRIGVLNTVLMSAFHLTLPPLPVNNVIGKARFIVWPPSRWGGVRAVNPQQNH